MLFALLITLLRLMVRAKLWQVARERWVELVVVDCAFSIYAGWVTAASIVNVVSSNHVCFFGFLLPI
jgi:hypothetical protein